MDRAVDRVRSGVRRAKVPSPLLWFHFLAHTGAIWPVFLSTVELSPVLVNDAAPAGPPLMGVVDFRSQFVIINARHNEAEQDATLLHEIAHVALRTWSTSNAAHHRVIRPLEEPLWACLAACGMRWPRRPRGYAALRRWAIANAQKSP